MHKSYPCEKQEGRSDCGVACLKTILKTYHGKLSQTKLRELTNTTKEGVDAYSLLEAAKQIGLQGKGVAGSFTKIPKAALPCIAHVLIDQKYPHFVVLHDILPRKKQVIIADPAIGLKTLSFSTFQQQTTDHYLYLKPYRALPTDSVSSPLTRIIKEVLYQEKCYLIYLWVLGIMAVILPMMLSRELSFFIDTTLVNYPLNSLKTTAVLFLGLQSVYLLVTSISEYWCEKLSQRIDLAIFRSVLYHLFFLPPLSYKSYTSGELLTYLKAITPVKTLLISLFLFVTLDIPFVLFILFFLWKQSSSLTEMVLLLGGAVILLSLSFLRLERYLQQELFVKKIKVEEQLVENLTHMETRKALHQEEREVERLSEQYESLLSKTLQLMRTTIGKHFFSEWILKIGGTLLLVLGTKQILGGSLTIGSLVSYQSLYFYFITTLSRMGSFGTIWKEGKISFKKLDGLLEHTKENFSYHYSYQNIPVQGDLMIRNLSFSYPYQSLLFPSLSLDIKKGEKILLYGESGCGKSTLLKLFLRYFKVGPHQIFIDGKDINLYHLEVLRNHILYVSQQEQLFTGSFYDNITDQETITYEAFLKITQMTEVDAIVKQDPLLYDRMIEEGGSNLSGGERQRIIIARSLAHHPSVYLFDESFNQIDQECERRMLQNIFAAYPLNTFLVVTHRLENKDLFDRVFEVTKEGVRKVDLHKD